jgi:hypothetical protein
LEAEVLRFGATGALSAEANLFDWFRGRVETAVAHRSAPVSETAVYYLSALLAEQGRREDEEPREATLVELRQRAADAPFADAVGLWRRLGDQSLMAVGFFREHLERRKLSPTYYGEMGRSAYGALARLLRDPSGETPDVFGELADRYEACTEVIAEVRDETRECNATDIVRLYEEYLATGSPRIAERQIGRASCRERVS